MKVGEHCTAEGEERGRLRGGKQDRRHVAIIVGPMRPMLRPLAMLTEEW